MTLLFSLIQRCFSPLWQIFQSALRLWTKPDNRSLPLNAALDLNRTKPELMLENALLRQQLIVLQRQIKRPKLICRSHCTSDNGLWNFAWVDRPAQPAQYIIECSI